MKFREDNPVKWIDFLGEAESGFINFSHVLEKKKRYFSKFFSSDIPAIKLSKWS